MLLDWDCKEDRPWIVTLIVLYTLIVFLIGGAVGSLTEEKSLVNELCQRTEYDFCIKTTYSLSKKEQQ